MGYKSAADGITHKGKTKGKNLGDSGPHDKIEVGKKSSTGGICQDKMQDVGRGLAKVAANGK